MGYVLGINVGATFTDCAAVETGVEGARHVEFGTARTTRSAAELGALDAIAAAAGRFALTTRGLLQRTGAIHLGVPAWNVLAVDDEHKFGMIAEGEGHETAPETRNLILDRSNGTADLPSAVREEVRSFSSRLGEEGVEALAIVASEEIDRAVRELSLRNLVRQAAPGTFTSLSSEWLGGIGRSERVSLAIANARCGPLVRAYLARQEELLSEHGFRRSIWVMSCWGGVVSLGEARRVPLRVIGAGAVGGLIGSAALATRSSARVGHIVAIDLSGDGCSVGLVEAADLSSGVIGGLNRVEPRLVAQVPNPDDPRGRSGEVATDEVAILEQRIAGFTRFLGDCGHLATRKLSLYAYGKSGPIHAMAIARALGIRHVVVPLGNLAAGWSALGVAAAEAAVIQETRVDHDGSLDPELLNHRWGDLETRALQMMAAQGIASDQVQLERSVSMRYASEADEVQVRASTGPFDDAAVIALVCAFEQNYQRRFESRPRPASADHGITRLRVRATAPVGELTLSQLDAVFAPATPGDRGDGDEVLEGPRTVKFTDTSVPLGPGDRASMTEVGLDVELHPG